MFWKVISRTIQSLLAIGGLVMQGVGLYFDVLRVGQAPEGPLGISIFGWGAILFMIFSVSVIGQLWWHIRTLENSYAYSLSFEGLQGNPRANDLQIGLVFKNTIEKPIEYKVDVSKLYIEISGNRPVNPKYTNSGGVIPKGTTTQFKYPSLKIPESFPCKGTLRYELVYGRPGKMMFRQRREMELDVQGISGKLYLNLTYTLQEDNPIGK